MSVVVIELFVFWVVESLCKLSRSVFFVVTTFWKLPVSLAGLISSFRISPIFMVSVSMLTISKVLVWGLLMLYCQVNRLFYEIALRLFGLIFTDWYCHSTTPYRAEEWPIPLQVFYFTGCIQISVRRRVPKKSTKWKSFDMFQTFQGFRYYKNIMPILFSVWLFADYQSADLFFCVSGKNIQHGEKVWEKKVCRHIRWERHEGSSWHGIIWWKM